MRGLPKRRRHEQKTDYNARLSLLKSSKPRLVVRKTNRYMIVQIVKSQDAQDTVILNVTSKDLLGNGWPEAQSGSLKSRVAAYLTGYLAAKSALKIGVKEAILDMGMHRNVKNSRIFALVRGAIDGGLALPAGAESLPTDEDLAKDKNSSLIDKIRSKL